MLPLAVVFLGYSGGGGEGGSGQTCDALNLCNVPWDGATAVSCPSGMTKVAPPERTGIYTLTSPSASYTPSGLVEVHLRVTARLIQKKLDAGVRQCQCNIALADCSVGYKPCGATYADGAQTATEPYMENAKYIGLLLYAVRENDPTEAKVGAWEIPVEIPARFNTPPDAGCGGRALMHASANAKNYFHRFHFRAPSEAGTGTLVFRALIKQGETNGGAFYWPNAGAAPSPGGRVSGDLALAEGTSPPPAAQLWFRAAPLESCASACATAGRTCDEAAMAVASAAADIPAEVGRRYLCRRPFLRHEACAAAGALPAGTNQPDALCWAAAVGVEACTGPSTSPANACTAVSSQADLVRFCACSAPASRRALAAAAFESSAYPASSTASTASAASSTSAATAATAATTATAVTAATAASTTTASSAAVSASTTRTPRGVPHPLPPERDGRTPCPHSGRTAPPPTVAAPKGGGGGMALAATIGRSKELCGRADGLAGRLESIVEVLGATLPIALGAASRNARRGRGGVGGGGFALGVAALLLASGGGGGSGVAHAHNW